MNKSFKSLVLILIISFSAVLISGCYDSNEIDDLAYVIAIGIDKADKNSFNLTFQTAVPQSIAGGEGESLDTKTFKTDNFLSGLKNANRYLDRKINLSHTQIIVVSEEIAKEGVVPFLNGFQENIEIRPKVKIVVAAEGAQEYIKSIQPKLSSNPAKYYELLFSSYETDYLIKDIQLEDYLYRAKNQNAQPVAIYTAEDKTIKEDKKSSAGKSGKSDEEGKKSGGGSDKPEEKKEKAMAIKGLAVFNTDKMVGKLNENEAVLFALMTTKKSKEIEIEDPLDKKFKIISNLKKLRSSSTKVTLDNGKPKIKINLKFTIDIKAVQSNNNYNEPEKADKLKMAYEQYLNQGLTNLLNKATKEFKSDIFGFDLQAKRNFMTIDEWKNAKWQEIFPKSNYDLNIDVEVRRQS